jgi:hypothetical protein
VARAVTAVLVAMDKTPAFPEVKAGMVEVVEMAI